MPYYVHLKTESLDDLSGDQLETLRQTDTRAEAFELLKRDFSQETHAISFLASTEEIANWRRRERARFRHGTYIAVPWADRQPYDLESVHHVHLSLDCPGKVAYTPDAEHGVIDKQIRMTPGRYLERFYGNRFVNTEIAEYVAQVSGTGATYSIACTVEDVRTVYRNGPASCMGGPEDHTDEYWKESSLGGHMPAEVYAEPGDLAVAYFGPIDRPSQRTVVWPAEKRFVRIYGTGPLERLLRQDGYTDQPRFSGGSYGTLIGARVPAVSVRGGYLMPYLDGADGGYVDGRYIVLCDDSDSDHEFNCQSTGGVVWTSARARQRYEEEEAATDEDDYVTCEHCGDRTNVDDMSGDLCQSCADESWTCDGCHSTYFGGTEQTEIGDGYFCESCTNDRTETCQDEDCSETWIEANEFTDEETATRKTRDLDDLCPACAARYSWCDHCETVYDDPICPTCERAPRCTHTADLLANVPAVPLVEEPGTDENAATCNCAWCDPVVEVSFDVFWDNSVSVRIDNGYLFTVTHSATGLASYLRSCVAPEPADLPACPDVDGNPDDCTQCHGYGSECPAFRETHPGFPEYVHPVTQSQIASAHETAF